MGAEKRIQASASEIRNLREPRVIGTPGRTFSPDNATSSTPEKERLLAQRPRKGVLVVFNRDRRSLDDHLTVHPWMRRADVVVNARLIEFDRLRFALGDRTCAPTALVLHQ